MSELEDLVAFALLVEAGSFTAAAERLGCSKGQLSKRISGLERSLGSQLLHRTTRRLHLTAAGAALLPEAQALQAQAQRARQAVRSLQDEVAGTVRLTVPVSLGETFFDALLLDFASRYPQVRVELDLANAYRDLLADGFDLAIRSGVEPSEESFSVRSSIPRKSRRIWSSSVISSASTSGESEPIASAPIWLNWR